MTEQVNGQKLSRWDMFRIRHGGIVNAPPIDESEIAVFKLPETPHETNGLRLAPNRIELSARGWSIVRPIKRTQTKRFLEGGE